MSKQTAPQQSTSEASKKATDGDTQTPNNAAPRKARKASIKYQHVIQSEYRPTDNPDAMNPLDKPAISTKGGLKFPGVEFKATPVGIYVNIPARSTRILNPTVRQLLKVLDALYK